MPDITSNGIRLSYETRGACEPRERSDGRPPVLFICGTGQGAASWWPIHGGSLVTAGYEVTVFDNRGMPPSEVPPGPYSVSAMADDAIGLLEHLGGPRILMGASLGGLITQTVSLRRPDLVRAAVFLGGCGSFSHYARAMMQGDVDSARAGITLSATLTRLRMVELMMAPDRRGDDATFDLYLSMAGMFGDPDPVGYAGQVEADLAWANEENHITELAGLSVPALAFGSQHDPLFPPALVKQAVAAMPDATYVELEGGNHIPLEQFPFAIEQILKFLAALPE